MPGGFIPPEQIQNRGPQKAPAFWGGKAIAAAKAMQAEEG